MTPPARTPMPYVRHGWLAPLNCDIPPPHGGAQAARRAGCAAHRASGEGDDPTCPTCAVGAGAGRMAGRPPATAPHVGGRHEVPLASGSDGGGGALVPLPGDHMQPPGPPPAPATTDDALGSDRIAHRTRSKLVIDKPLEELEAELPDVDESAMLDGWLDLDGDVEEGSDRGGTGDGARSSSGVGSGHGGHEGDYEGGGGVQPDLTRGVTDAPAAAGLNPDAAGGWHRTPRAGQARRPRWSAVVPLLQPGPLDGEADMCDDGDTRTSGMDGAHGSPARSRGSPRFNVPSTGTGVVSAVTPSTSLHRRPSPSHTGAPAAAGTGRDRQVADPWLGHELAAPLPRERLVWEGLGSTLDMSGIVGGPLPLLRGPRSVLSEGDDDEKEEEEEDGGGGGEDDDDDDDEYDPLRAESSVGTGGTWAGGGDSRSASTGMRSADGSALVRGTGGLSPAVFSIASSAGTGTSGGGTGTSDGDSDSSPSDEEEEEEDGDHDLLSLGRAGDVDGAPRLPPGVTVSAASITVDLDEVEGGGLTHHTPMGRDGPGRRKGRNDGVTQEELEGLLADAAMPAITDVLPPRYLEWMGASPTRLTPLLPPTTNYAPSPTVMDAMPASPPRTLRRRQTSYDGNASGGGGGGKSVRFDMAPSPMASRSPTHDMGVGGDPAFAAWMSRLSPTGGASASSALPPPPPLLLPMPATHPPTILHPSLLSLHAAAAASDMSEDGVPSTAPISDHRGGAARADKHSHGMSERTLRRRRATMRKQLEAALGGVASTAPSGNGAHGNAGAITGGGAPMHTSLEAALWRSPALQHTLRGASAARDGGGTTTPSFVHAWTYDTISQLPWSMARTWIMGDGCGGVEGVTGMAPPTTRHQPPPTNPFPTHCTQLLRRWVDCHAAAGRGDAILPHIHVPNWSAQPPAHASALSAHVDLARALFNAVESLSAIMRTVDAAPQALWSEVVKHDQRVMTALFTHAQVTLTWGTTIITPVLARGTHAGAASQTDAGSQLGGGLVVDLDALEEEEGVGMVHPGPRPSWPPPPAPFLHQPHPPPPSPFSRALTLVKPVNPVVLSWAEGTPPTLAHGSSDGPVAGGAAWTRVVSELVCITLPPTVLPGAEPVGDAGQTAKWVSPQCDLPVRLPWSPPRPGAAAFFTAATMARLMALMQRHAQLTAVACAATLSHVRRALAPPPLPPATTAAMAATVEAWQRHTSASVSAVLRHMMEGVVAFHRCGCPISDVAHAQLAGTQLLARTGPLFQSHPAGHRSLPPDLHLHVLASARCLRIAFDLAAMQVHVNGQPPPPSPAVPCHADAPWQAAGVPPQHVRDGALRMVDGQGAGTAVMDLDAMEGGASGSAALPPPTATPAGWPCGGDGPLGASDDVVHAIRAYLPAVAGGGLVWPSITPRAHAPITRRMEKACGRALRVYGAWAFLTRSTSPSAPMSVFADVVSHLRPPHTHWAGWTATARVGLADAPHLPSPAVTWDMDEDEGGDERCMEASHPPVTLGWSLPDPYAGPGVVDTPATDDHVGNKRGRLRQGGDPASSSVVGTSKRTRMEGWGCHLATQDAMLPPAHDLAPAPYHVVGVAPYGRGGPHPSAAAKRTWRMSLLDRMLAWAVRRYGFMLHASYGRAGEGVVEGGRGVGQPGPGDAGKGVGMVAAPAMEAVASMPTDVHHVHSRQRTPPAPGGGITLPQPPLATTVQASDMYCVRLVPFILPRQLAGYVGFEMTSIVRRLPSFDSACEVWKGPTTYYLHLPPPVREHIVALMQALPAPVSLTYVASAVAPQCGVALLFRLLQDRMAAVAAARMAGGHEGSIWDATASASPARQATTASGGVGPPLLDGGRSAATLPMRTWLHQNFNDDESSDDEDYVPEEEEDDDEDDDDEEEEEGDGGGNADVARREMLTGKVGKGMTVAHGVGVRRDVAGQGRAVAATTARHRHHHPPPPLVDANVASAVGM